MLWIPTSSPSKRRQKPTALNNKDAPDSLSESGASLLCVFRDYEFRDAKLPKAALDIESANKQRSKSKKRVHLAVNSFFASEEFGLSPLLLDACFLASEATEIVEASATNLADAVNNYLLDERRIHREDTLNTDTARNLADSEALTNALTLNLDDDTLVNLNTLLVTLLNLVGDRNSVTRLECWQLDAGLESVLSNFD